MDTKLIDFAYKIAVSGYYGVSICGIPYVYMANSYVFYLQDKNTETIVCTLLQDILDIGKYDLSYFKFLFKDPHLRSIMCISRLSKCFEKYKNEVFKNSITTKAHIAKDVCIQKMVHEGQLPSYIDVFNCVSHTRFNK